VVPTNLGKYTLLKHTVGIEILVASSSWCSKGLSRTVKGYLYCRHILSPIEQAITNCTVQSLSLEAQSLGRSRHVCQIIDLILVRRVILYSNLGPQTSHSDGFS
jgi:hypothetical protein